MNIAIIIIIFIVVFVFVAILFSSFYIISIIIRIKVLKNMIFGSADTACTSIITSTISSSITSATRASYFFRRCSPLRFIFVGFTIAIAIVDITNDIAVSVVIVQIGTYTNRTTTRRTSTTT